MAYLPYTLAGCAEQREAEPPGKLGGFRFIQASHITLYVEPFPFILRFQITNASLIARDGLSRIIRNNPGDESGFNWG